MIINQPIKRLLLLIWLSFVITIQFWISQQTQAKTRALCTSYPHKATQIRKISIDNYNNYSTWYEMIISNWEDITSYGLFGAIPKEIWWNLTIYLIPRYIDKDEYIIKKHDLIQDSITRYKNINFDFERYKIWTIPYDNYYDEVDYEPNHWQYVCVDWDDKVPTTKYHYTIQQKWDNFELILSDIEKNWYSYYWFHRTIFLLKQIIYKYKYWWFSGLFIILLYIWIRIFKMIRNKRGKSSSK